MMKQRTSEADLHLQFTEEEKEVAAIFLDLQFCTFQKGVQGGWPLKWATQDNLVWGCRRKRSALAAAAVSPSPSPSPVPSVQRRKTCAQIECGMKTAGQVKVEATSPATPLAFAPSESDDNKSKHCHRKSSKKRVISSSSFFLFEFFSSLFPLMPNYTPCLSTYQTEAVPFFLLCICITPTQHTHTHTRTYIYI